MVGLLNRWVCWMFGLLGLSVPLFFEVRAVEVSFQRDVAPIFLHHCVACHGAKKAEGGFRLDTFEQLLRPGDSGEPSVVAWKSDESEAFRRLIAEDHAERMPADSEPLKKDEIELIRSWIAQGAKFDGKAKDLPLYAVIPAIQYPPAQDKYKFAIPVTAIEWSSDCKTVYTSGYHELLAWDAEKGVLKGRIANLPERIFAIKASPDGKGLAVGCGTPGRLGEVRWIDLASSKVVNTILRISDSVLDVAFSPDGKMLAVAGADAIVRVVETQSFKEVRTIASHADWVTGLAWNNDGTLLATASRDKSAKVTKIPTENS